MEERQTNYTIAEGYALPSKGLIYSKKIDPNIELRSMTARDEMKRLNPSATQFKTLADIIDGCIVEKPGISVYDMALGDYEYLLHKLRVVTYGDEYKIVVGCPHCGKDAIEAIAHLDDLEVKDFDIEDIEELRTFQLPRSNHTITIRFTTPRMLDEIDSRAKEMRRKFKDAAIDFKTLVSTQLSIEAVDGTPLDATKAETFISKLPAADLLKIQMNVERLNNSIGLRNEMHVTCPDCGGDILTFFRFGPEFFRPTTI